jgi:hypothetical protein
MKAVEQENGRTMLMTDDGAPALVGLRVRASATAPNRLKAVLLAEADGQMVPMPFAQPTVPTNAKRKLNGVAVEFRMEMN